MPEEKDPDLQPEVERMTIEIPLPAGYVYSNRNNVLDSS